MKLLALFWLAYSAISMTTLSVVDLDAIVMQKQRLIISLESRKDLLEQGAKGAADNSTAVSNLKLLNSRIKHLHDLDSVLANSLQLYYTILQAKDAEKFDEFMENETELIIQEFQKIVLSAKNYQKTQSSNKKEEEKKPDTETTNIVENVLKDVAQKADSLENNLNQNTFEEQQNQKGSTIETVIKVNPGEKEETALEGNAPSSVLIDSSNNQYVLSKPGDATAHVQDQALLKDIMLLLIVCFLFVIVMFLLNLPTFFGYILAGIVLGQYQFITNSVQVETIARGLGVIFIMFFLGLEFNFAKIKKVLSISIFGSLLILFLTVVCIVFVGRHFGAMVSETIVIGACVFLSSTAVALHLLDSNELEYSYGQTIMGVLVAQDVMLGFLLALMPMLLTSGEQAFMTILGLFTNLGLFLLACVVLQYPLLFGLSWIAKRAIQQEIFLLGSVGFCLLIVQVGFLFNQSIELSCFVAGMMIGSRKTLTDKVVHTVEPLRQLFGTLFFASIGLFIYPQFLITEGLLLIFLTIGTVFFKVFLTTFILWLLFKQNFKNALVIAVGLGQISEFTFVLASKAKQAQILSRDSYFLLVGVTTMSMILSPILWHLTKCMNRDGFSKVRDEDLDMNSPKLDLEY